MLVTLVTFGSRGDAEPFVALSERLAAAGHDVRLVTHAAFASLAEGAGFELRAARGRSVKDLMETPEARALLAGVRNPLRAVRGLAELIGPDLTLLYEDTADAVAGADVVLCSPATMPGLHAAERFGVPVVHAELQPLVPTSEFPVPAAWLGVRTLGGWGNRASYAIDEALAALLMRRPVNDCRRRVLGLPPQGVRAARAQRKVGVGALVAVSPRAVPRPPDWPPQVRLCGWWWRDQPDDAAGPDPAVADFLAAGPPPLLVTLGSMPVRDADATTELVVGAARDAGVRLILQRGWADLGAGVAPSSDVLVVGDLPHDALLAHVGGVAHHGGAGTTGRALLHGRPSVALPVLADQFFWGRRLHALGVGPPPLPLAKLDRAALAGRLRALAGDDGYARRAAWLGAELRAEDGCGTAVAALDELLSRQSRLERYC